MIGLHESHKSGVGNVGCAPVIDRKNWVGHSGVGRWLTVLAVPLLTCGGLGVAHAAWELKPDGTPDLTADYNGSATGSYTTISGNYVSGAFSHHGPVTNWVLLSGEAAASNGALAEVKANGTFTYTFKWKPDYGQTLQSDPPPDKLTIQVFNVVETDVQSYGINPATGIAEAENGLGNPTVLTDHDPPSAYRDAMSIGTRLFTKSVAPGSDTVTFTFPFNATASATAPSTTFGNNSIMCFMWVEVYATEDTQNREVRLSRPGARGPVKIQGALGVTIDPERDEWVEPDGTAHGQSRWSYTERIKNPPLFGAPDYADNSVSLTQLIAAQKGGQWSPSLSGQWSPSHSMDQQHPQSSSPSHVQKLPDGGALLSDDGIVATLPGWYNVPSNAHNLDGSNSNPVTVSYVLKDNADGAEAEGKYFLHLHDEWENPVTDPAFTWPDGTHPGETYRTESMDLDVPRIDGPQTNKSWTFASVTTNLTAQLKTNFGANFKLKDWFTAGGSFETSAKLEIESQYEATAPTLTLAQGESAVPCVNYIVRTSHKLLDHYEVNGWAGKESKSADLPVAVNDISANWHTLTTGQPLEP